MIDFNWDQFGPINVWQTTGTIAVIIIAFWLFVRAAPKIWPRLKKTIALVDSLGGLPNHMEVTQKFMIATQEFMTSTTEFTERTDGSLEKVRHEVQYNNGSSVKDGVNRVEEGVAGLHGKFEEHLIEFEKFLLIANADHKKLLELEEILLADIEKKEK